MQPLGGVTSSTGATAPAVLQLVSRCDVSRASRVTVTFTAAGAQTLVTLQHDGWEVFDDPDTARAEYEHGWPTVLDRYEEAVASERNDWPQ